MGWIQKQARPAEPLIARSEALRLSNVGRVLTSRPAAIGTWRHARFGRVEDGAVANPAVACLITDTRYIGAVHENVVLPERAVGLW